MSVEFYRESPGKFDSRTLNRKTLNMWTGRMPLLCNLYATWSESVRLSYNSSNSKHDTNNDNTIHHTNTTTITTTTTTNNNNNIKHDDNNNDDNDDNNHKDNT